MNNSRFLPSELYATGYGDFGTTASQRRKRDRDKRRKERALDDYKKCVAKRGKADKKCKNDLARALKYEEKEKTHSAKLEKKGKTTYTKTTAAYEAGKTTRDEWVKNKQAQAAAAKAALVAGAQAAGEQIISNMVPEDEFVSEDVMVEGQDSSGSGLGPVVIGGIAVATLLGAVVYFRRPKQK